MVHKNGANTPKNAKCRDENNLKNWVASTVGSTFASTFLSENTPVLRGGNAEIPYNILQYTDYITGG